MHSAEQPQTQDSLPAAQIWTRPASQRTAAAQQSGQEQEAARQTPTHEYIQMKIKKEKSDTKNNGG
jgi:redox-sensitive bicupin YhaK (pirin superfamily)